MQKEEEKERKQKEKKSKRCFEEISGERGGSGCMHPYSTRHPN